MRLIIPVKCPDGRMELWDTKLMETSVTLKIMNMAEQPKVLKTKKKIIKVSKIAVSSLIIYMKKLLDSDWLRAVQFRCNTSAKSVTPVQKV